MSSQLSFELPPANTMTIAAVADALQVATASVRNWVKAGYLEAINGSYISRSSFDIFKASIVGTEKLIARANKSNFDSHDHSTVQASFLNRVKHYESLDFDNIGTAYETSLANSYRNKEAIYYTPADIVARFFAYIKGDVSHLIFCDPCCGSGNFIIAALARGFLPKNIYGFDIDPVAVAITRARFKHWTNLDSNNVYTVDFLADVIMQQNSEFAVFDVILTNPPWGKKLTIVQKQLFSKAFNCSKSTDTSALFLRAALLKVSTNGIIGMLLPDAFFNISTFRTTRELVSNQHILGFIDFGKPFQGLLTKAKGVVFRKHDIPPIDNNIVCATANGTHFRSQHSFLKNPKHIFNFECTHVDADTVSHLYGIPHLTLDGNAKWGLGIVTGNNKKYVKTYHEKNHIPVYKGSQIVYGTLPAPKYFIPSNLCLYQQVAPYDIYQAPEKLIYRFISAKLIFHHDTKSTLFLNSANALVLNSDFGVSHTNLAWLLNTRLMNWVFRKIFDTHKVLRSDLENLPIFHEFFSATQHPTENKLYSYLNIIESSNGSFRIKK